jgi:tellurite resistance protein TerC
MNEIAYPWWAWIGFATVIFAALAVDLGLFNRKSHAPSYKETIGWSVAWVSMALIFNAVIFWQFG